MVNFPSEVLDVAGLESEGEGVVDGAILEDKSSYLTPTAGNSLFIHPQPFQANFLSRGLSSLGASIGL